jgi:hypothetical protein
LVIEKGGTLSVREMDYASDLKYQFLEDTVCLHRQKIDNIIVCYQRIIDDESMKNVWVKWQIVDLVTAASS